MMQQSEKRPCGCCPATKGDDVGCGRYRMVLGILGFLIFLTQYTHRAGMSIAIVSMVNHTYLVNNENHVSYLELAEISVPHGANHYVPVSDDDLEMPSKEPSDHLDLKIIQPSDSSLVGVHSTGQPDGASADRVHSSGQLRVYQAELPSENASIPRRSALHHGNASRPKVVECHDDFQQTSILKREGPFSWSKPQQGFILGAFNYGYAASQVPAAILSSRFGGKIIVTLSILIGGVASLLLPLVASTSYIFVIIIRAIIGLTVGATYPAMFTIFSQWVPPLERTFMCGCLYAGGGLGLVIANPIAAFFCHNHSDGWAFVFYTFGALTLITLPFWVLLMTNTPDTNPYITPRETNYIKSQLRGQLVHAETDIPPIPWLKIVTSVPLWAIVIGMCTTDWGYTIYLAYIPSYMHDVLRFDLQKNGLLSSLPFIAHFFVLMFFPLVVDKIVASKLLPGQTTRKLAHSIGALGAAVCLLGLSTMDCRQSHLAVFALTAGVMLCACVYSGFPVNVIDVAPVYAGTILGVTNTVSALVGGICTPIVATLTTNHTHTEWQHVFYLTSGIYTVGTVLYCLLGSTKLQPWAHVTTSEPMSKDTQPIYCSHAEILPEVKVLVDEDTSSETSVDQSDQISRHHGEEERQHLAPDTDTNTFHQS